MKLCWFCFFFAQVWRRRTCWKWHSRLERARWGRCTRVSTSSPAFARASTGSFPRTRTKSARADCTFPSRGSSTKQMSSSQSLTQRKTSSRYFDHPLELFFQSSDQISGKGKIICASTYEPNVNWAFSDSPRVFSRCVEILVWKLGMFKQ